MRAAAPRRRPVTFTQAPDGSVTLNPSDAPTWQQYVTDFDQAVSQTQAQLQALQQQGPPADPNGQALYAQLVSAGQGWLGRLQDLQAMRDSVSGWLSGVNELVNDPFAQMGLNGMRARGSQLGIVPLIVAGVGLAAFAAVVYGAIQWAEQAQRFSQLNAQAQAAIAQGVPSQTAYAQAAKTLAVAAPSSGGFFSTLGTNVLWIVGGVVLALWIGPKLLERLSRGGHE